MTPIFSIRPDYRSGKIKAALEAFKAEHGAVVRRVETVRDVVLADGRVLPNRRLVRDVYDLADGRTVEIKTTNRYYGVSNSTAFGFDVFEVAA